MSVSTEWLGFCIAYGQWLMLLKVYFSRNFGVQHIHPCSQPFIYFLITLCTSTMKKRSQKRTRPPPRIVLLLTYWLRFRTIFKIMTSSKDLKAPCMNLRITKSRFPKFFKVIPWKKTNHFNFVLVAELQTPEFWGLNRNTFECRIMLQTYALALLLHPVKLLLLLIYQVPICRLNTCAKQIGPLH